VAKSFPAEKGFDANVLSVQVHGGYGYSSEYLPEAWLRDQKLNSLHEGTTGIQSMDLLGRKVTLGGGSALEHLEHEVLSVVERARRAGVDAAWCDGLSHAMQTTRDLTRHLSTLGSAERTLRHSADYLDLFGTLVVGFVWLWQAAIAKEAIDRAPSGAGRPFYEGKLCAAQYWILTELPRVDVLATLCRSEEDSYARVRPDWL